MDIFGMVFPWVLPAVLLVLLVRDTWELRRLMVSAREERAKTRAAEDQYEDLVERYNRLVGEYAEKRKEYAHTDDCFADYQKDVDLLKSERGRLVATNKNLSDALLRIGGIIALLELEIPNVRRPDKPSQGDGRRPSGAGVSRVLCDVPEQEEVPRQ